MHSLVCVALVFVAAVSAMNSTKSSACKPFPSSTMEFSAQFEQPKPPTINPEFQTSFIQHKWDQNLSHITSGYIYNSPSQNLVLVYQAYEDGFGSSSFDYSNVTDEGFVDNTIAYFSGSSLTPDVWRGYVNSNFVLFNETFLIDYDAVFGGLVERDMIPGHVASWNIMYQDAIPVTVYVSTCNDVVGWDYFSPGRRTRVITEFFNTYSGTVHV